MKIKTIFAVIFCFIALTDLLSQSVSGVPVDIQLILIPKILSMDTQVKYDKKIGVGIIYHGSLRNSAQIKDDLLKFAAEKKLAVNGQGVAFIEIDVSKNVDLNSIIKKENIKALYITPLRSYNIEYLLNMCKLQKVLSFTCVPEFADLGISIYFDLANNKPRININLKTVEAEGTSFKPEFLNVVNIKK